MPRTPELAILIVSYNTRRDLENCLRSLHDHPPAISHEIVVIDNGSRDGSIEALRQNWPGVRLVVLGANIGFGRANNVGFRETASELVLLLNSDTLVPPNAVDRLVHAFQRLPGAAVAGPRIIDATGRVELSFGRMIGPLAEVRQKALLRFGGRDRINAMVSRTREVDWVSAACLLVRRLDAEAAGLFDERYFMYCEDVDFCAAIRANGGRVYFTPEAEIVHLKGKSAAINPSATHDAYRRSQLAFYRKHRPAWEPILRLYLALQGKLPRETADN